MPVTEILTPGIFLSSSCHSSNAPSDHEHRLPASMPALLSARTGPRFSRLIGIVTLLGIIGAGAWCWWKAGTPPVHYKTALVDRVPITTIVNATDTALFALPLSHRPFAMPTDLSSRSTNEWRASSQACTLSSGRWGIHQDEEGRRLCRHSTLGYYSPAEFEARTTVA